MTDVSVTPGTKGLTRSTWRDENHLRGVLLRLKKQHPDAAREEIEARYLARVKKIPALVEEAIERAFDNDWASSEKPIRRPRQHSETADIDDAEKRLASIVLLDLVQPNGKKLRDCTGAECRQTGGWLTAVADRIGNRGVVGAKLSEAELAAIFATRLVA